MSRNQLLVIVGVLLVLGVAVQRGMPFQIVPGVVCPSCPGSIMLPGLLIIGTPGSASPALESRRQPSSEAELMRVLKAWIATPEPLFVPPTTTPQDAGWNWDMDCLNC